MSTGHPASISGLLVEITERKISAVWATLDEEWKWGGGLALMLTKTAKSLWDSVS